MDIRKLQRAIVDGLEDVKAQHIAVFNTEHLSALFERVIIASGTSNRQTKSLAASVRDSVRGKGLDVMRTEGEENGEWIIVDCGAAVVHIMQPAIREYYHLEEIWGGKTVNMKLAADGSKGLVKASEAKPRATEPKVSPRYVQADKASPKPVVKPTRKKATAKRPATPRTGHATYASDGAATAHKPAARKPASRRVAAKTDKTAKRPPARKPRA
jgi:ribosome-associated protein